MLPTRTREISPGVGAATIEVPIPHEMEGAVFYAQWVVFGDSGEEFDAAASTRVLEIEINPGPGTLQRVGSNAPPQVVEEGR